MDNENGLTSSNIFKGIKMKGSRANGEHRDVASSRFDRVNLRNQTSRIWCAQITSLSANHHSL